MHRHLTDAEWMDRMQVQLRRVQLLVIVSILGAAAAVVWL
jgi:hypothetical protein